MSGLFLLLQLATRRTEGGDPVSDVEAWKTAFNYGLPAVLLLGGGIGLYRLLLMAGKFLAPIISDLTKKHISTMDTFEVVGKGLLQQQEAQTALMKRHDDTLVTHTEMIDQIHKAVVKQS